jgi:hypothetical protein
MVEPQVSRPLDVLGTALAIHIGVLPNVITNSQDFIPFSSNPEKVMVTVRNVLEIYRHEYRFDTTLVIERFRNPANFTISRYIKQLDINVPFENLGIQLEIAR